jgi:hypothetical protein
MLIFEKLINVLLLCIVYQVTERTVQAENICDCLDPYGGRLIIGTTRELESIYKSRGIKLILALEAHAETRQVVVTNSTPKLIQVQRLKC